MLAGIRVDDDLLDADEPFIVENPTFEDLQQSQKTSMVVAGSRYIPFKSRIIRSKPNYMLRNEVENVLLSQRTTFSYFWPGCARHVRSIRLPARLVSGSRHCTPVFTRQRRRFTRCLSTDTSNRTKNRYSAHPSNIQSEGLLLIQRCRSEDDDPVLLKKRNGLSPGNMGSILSNLMW
jgi:hypothetical protein